jgi:methylglutaconyl-CoA hydratase
MLFLAEIIVNSLVISFSAGGTQRITRIVGIAKAKELVFTGQSINFDEAHRLGLCNQVHSVSAYNGAIDMAKKIIPNGPVALRLAKLALDRGSEVDM